MSKGKVIVIIPAYEPPQTFVDYAERVSKFAQELVVVNDGSSSEYDGIFKKIQSIQNVKYIAYAQNKGKGYALKQALSYCVDNYGEDLVCVTADCDGQHDVADIERVAEAAFDHPDTLVLGSRNFDDPSVPKRSKIGNTNIRRIFRLLYGLNIRDTQTGLRGFSLRLAKEYLSVRGDRFEFEMEMLVQSRKSSVPIIEIPIKTIYPENPEEHVSHFKTFRDSARVVAVAVRNLNWYILSSALSGIIDIFVFFLLSSVLLDGISALNTLVATVCARVASSLLNFFINGKYVFGGKTKAAFVRYYILWLCQLGASYGLIFLFGNVLGLPLTPMKVMGDMVLSFFSYQIQQHWVFRVSNKNEFYGPFASAVKVLGRLFTKKYKSNVISPDEPTVYVCRHLNMHGPLTTLINLNFHLHPMVLYVFFDKNTCYKQYTEFTFSERRGKKKKKHNPLAYIASRIVPPLERSVRGIPVYRGDQGGSIKTLRAALECLKKGESVIVYPDIDYTAGYEKESEIYDGFLFLGQMYNHSTKKSLRFVPLYIDEKNKEIVEYRPVTVDNFRERRDVAYEYVKSSINGKKCSLI